MIKIVPYDPAWPTQFVEEAARIRVGLGPQALRIDHVGSTAVPGLKAKPIIDIQVSVRSLSPRGWLASRMNELGYCHLDLGEFDLVYPFFRRPAAWPQTHHVHICEVAGEQERKHLAFRDYLRSHPEQATEYAALKNRLAGVHLGRDDAERERYSLAKTDFVETTIQLAYAKGLPHLGSSDG
jgi:GrpB-like predicted nucleotidyltransferase (UPF0157 family)